MGDAYKDVEIKRTASKESLSEEPSTDDQLQTENQKKLAAERNNLFGRFKQMQFVMRLKEKGDKVYIGHKDQMIMEIFKSSN